MTASRSFTVGCSLECKSDVRESAGSDGLRRCSIWSLLNPPTECRSSILAMRRLSRSGIVRSRKKKKRNKVLSGYGQNRRSRSIAEGLWPWRIL